MASVSREATASLWQEVVRRKPVGVMTAETGADSGHGELARTIGLFQLTLFGVGAGRGVSAHFACDSRPLPPPATGGVLH